MEVSALGIIGNSAGELESRSKRRQNRVFHDYESTYLSYPGVSSSQPSPLVLSTKPDSSTRGIRGSDLTVVVVDLATLLRCPFGLNSNNI